MISLIKYVTKTASTALMVKTAFDLYKKGKVAYNVYKKVNTVKGFMKKKG